MKPLYIFDLDGTLRDCTHRKHLIKQASPDWPAFYMACAGDSAIVPTIAVLHALLKFGMEVWVFSGADEMSREITMKWLQTYTLLHLEPEQLMMRPTGSTMPDHIMKEQWLHGMLEVDRQRLIAVFDDRQKVVDMWRRNGVPCFQVAPGDF